MPKFNTNMLPLERAEKQGFLKLQLHAALNKRMDRL